MTPTQIILARLLCFLVPVGVLMLGPKDALLRRLWTGKTPRMWHLETIAVMICVSLVVLVFGNDPVEWVGFAALTLAHGRNSIMFRLSEEQEKSTPLDPHHVECGRWTPVYFFGSELCWATYFLLHRSWAALAGVAIFVSYGQWRRWYAKWRLLNELPRKGECDVKVVTAAPVESEKPDSCFFCGGPPWYWLPINFMRNGAIVVAKRVMVCADHYADDVAAPTTLAVAPTPGKPLSYAGILKASREMRANSQPTEEIACTACGELGRCYVFGQGPRLPYFCVKCRDKDARTLLDL